MKRCIITILFVLVFALQCACTSRKNDSMYDSVGSTESVSLSERESESLSETTDFSSDESEESSASRDSSDEENTSEPSEKQDGDNDVIWEN